MILLTIKLIFSAMLSIGQVQRNRNKKIIERLIKLVLLSAVCIPHNLPEQLDSLSAAAHVVELEIGLFVAAQRDWLFDINTYTF